MSIETIKELPQSFGRVTALTELIQAVNQSVEGTILKFTRNDGKPVNVATIRLTIENKTEKMVRVVKLSSDVVGVQILKKSDYATETKAREQRSKDMKAKLSKKQ